MKYQGFIGPTYKLDSVNVDCQRCVNLIPEQIESGTGKDGQQFYYKWTPGLRELFTVGTGPIRMIYADTPIQNIYNPPNQFFIASGNEFYRASFISGAWVVNKVDGEFATTTGPIRVVAKNTKGEDSDGVSIVMVDNSGNVYFYGRGQSGGVFSEEFDILDFTGIEEMKAGSSITWLDGFYTYNAKDSDRFYSSVYGVFGFDALNFATSEGDPDKIVAMLAVNRYLWILNERSTEVWATSGNSDFPFERVQGGFIEKGCLAPYSVAKADGTIFWLGRDQIGQGVVYAATGFTPQRISTHAVEQAIKNYSNASSATAYTYQSGGHTYYVLNFTEGTWVYDLKTGLWHERAYTSVDGELTRHRADCLTFSPSLSLHLVGDFENNKIYALEDNVFTDAGAPITRMRVAPHLSAGGKRIFYSSLQIDMETGVGLDGNVQGSDPQIMLDWSNDGGHTWSNEVWGSIGKKIGGIGDFKKRVKFNRLGSAYDRVFRLKITDPVPVTIISADLDFEVGAA